LISFLLISKVPTFAFKKISIPRHLTIFALFSVVLFFGLLLIYTFKVLLISAIIYLILIPLCFFQYQKMKKNNNFNELNNEEKNDPEDVL